MYRVGFFQFAPKFGEVANNLSKIVSALRGAEADIIVLPELAFTGYFFKDRSELSSLAEDPAKSPTVSSLIALCRDRNFFLVTGFAEKSADKIFNSALLVGGDGVLHTYRKLHLFNTEREYFDPGDTPLETIELRDAIGSYALPTGHAYSLLREFCFCCHCKPIWFGHSSERYSDFYRSKSNGDARGRVGLSCETRGGRTLYS
jgi:hypothetical protein